MTFMMKSRVDYIRGMLAIIQSKIFCLPVSYIKKLTIKIYKTVILPVVLYGCETWSLTLREERSVEEDIWISKGGRRIMEKTE
jgi:hypothetical protein